MICRAQQPDGADEFPFSFQVYRVHLVKPHEMAATVNDVRTVFYDAIAVDERHTIARCIFARVGRISEDESELADGLPPISLSYIDADVQVKSAILIEGHFWHTSSAFDDAPTEEVQDAPFLQ